MLNTVKTLGEARAKLVQGWCQNALAKTVDGTWVRGDHPDAVKWCAIGALQAVVPGEFRKGMFYRGGVIRALADTLASQLKENGSCWNSVADYNNTHTKEEVLALYDKTIERLNPKPDPAVRKLVNALKEAIRQEEAVVA